MGWRCARPRIPVLGDISSQQGETLMEEIYYVTPALLVHAIFSDVTAAV